MVPVIQRQCSDVHMTVPRNSTDTDDDTKEDVTKTYNGTFILPGKSAETGKKHICRQVKIILLWVVSSS